MASYGFFDQISDLQPEAPQVALVPPHGANVITDIVENQEAASSNDLINIDNPFLRFLFGNTVNSGITFLIRAALIAAALLIIFLIVKSMIMGRED